jgi:hypothetical protein
VPPRDAAMYPDHLDNPHYRARRPLVAGEITLNRRVIIFEGMVAMLIAGVCLGVVLGGPGPGLGLLAAVAVPAPYVIVSGVSPQRLGTFGLPQAWAGPLSDPLLRWCRLAERLRDDRARPGVKAASQGGRPADSRLSAISGAFLLGSRARSQCAPRGRFCRNPAVVRPSVLVRAFVSSTRVVSRLGTSGSAGGCSGFALV